MKTLGLIGGTTWVSTVDYYKYINQLTHERLGGSESARLILYSINFGDLVRFENADDWEFRDSKIRGRDGRLPTIVHSVNVKGL